MIAEGWGLPNGAKKWHYFTCKGRSLCGGYGFYAGDTELGNDNSPDNCAECKKRLAKLIAQNERINGGRR
jgi:hypothetical protein